MVKRGKGVADPKKPPTEPLAVEDVDPENQTADSIAGGDSGGTAALSGSGDTRISAGLTGSGDTRISAGLTGSGDTR